MVLQSSKMMQEHVTQRGKVFRFIPKIKKKSTGKEWDPFPCNFYVFLVKK